MTRQRRFFERWVTIKKRIAPWLVVKEEPHEFGKADYLALRDAQRKRDRRKARNLKAWQNDPNWNRERFQ